MGGEVRPKRTWGEGKVRPQAHIFERLIGSDTADVAVYFRAKGAGGAQWRLARAISAKRFSCQPATSRLLWARL